MGVYALGVGGGRDDLESLATSFRVENQSHQRSSDLPPDREVRGLST
jgi:hypothetical protein